VTLVLLLLGLLVGNAFFVTAEFALVSARRSAMETLAAGGSRGARVALGGMEQITLMLAGAQLGITLCSVGLGAVAEPAISDLLHPLARAVGLPPTVAGVAALAIALALVMFVHVVFGELVPKNFAMASPERAASVFGAALVAVVTVIKPVLWVVNGAANSAVRLFGLTPKSEVTSAFTPEEVAGMVAKARREGLLEDKEGALVVGALTFADRAVGVLAKPVAQMVTVAAGTSPEEVESLSSRTGYSRFPVTEGPDLIGYVHLKDVLETDPVRRRAPVARSVYRTLSTVSASDDLGAALTTMQDARSHLARVLGPAGVVEGIVTLEDVVAELVRDGTRRPGAAGPTAPSASRMPSEPAGPGRS